MYHLLSRRDHTQLELKQKLLAKGYELAEVIAIIDEFLKSRLINEQQFTENFIYWRRNRGYGPERIKQELKQRGIALTIIAEHLDIHDNDWLLQMRKIWQKHFKGKPPTNLNERAKQMRFLQYRGYTREQIEDVLNE